MLFAFQLFPFIRSIHEGETHHFSSSSFENVCETNLSETREDVR